MFSIYFLYVIERSVKEINVHINFKTKKSIWKMTDLGKMQKTAFLGHFLAFLDGKKQPAISGPHFKSLN